jgi:hypothetical protein
LFALLLLAGCPRPAKPAVSPMRTSEPPADADDVPPPAPPPPPTRPPDNDKDDWSKKDFSYKPLIPPPSRHPSPPPPSPAPAAPPRPKPADRDKDGFPDAQDKCPGEPETPNGIKDGDGCPD